MTRPVHPCTFPHVLGHAQRQQEEPKVEALSREPGDWTDEEIAEFAALEFKPWDVSDCPLPTNEQWAEDVNPYLMCLRLSWGIMGKTKAELVDMVEQLEADDALEPMMECMLSTETRMRGYHNLASAAQARLLCAATVVSLKREGGL